MHWNEVVTSHIAAVRGRLLYRVGFTLNPKPIYSLPSTNTKWMFLAPGKTHLETVDDTEVAAVVGSLVGPGAGILGQLSMLLPLACQLLGCLLVT